MKKTPGILTFICFLFFALSLCAQEEKLNAYIQAHQIQKIQYAPDTVHARGIQVVNGMIYTANSNGHVYSYDLHTSQSKQLTSQAFIELRDLHVFDEQSFIAMQSAESSHLLVKNRENSYQQEYTGAFFDGMDLNEKGFGMLMGDPISRFLQVYVKEGDKWILVRDSVLVVGEGEAGFAASGTTVQTINDSSYYFVTGGKESHLFKTKNYGRNWEKWSIPFTNSESSGPFSMCFWNEKEGLVVGGDYTKPNDTLANCFLTTDGGKTWLKPLKAPLGYRSCVLKSGHALYACGTNGVDVSIDNGITWYPLNRINCFAMVAEKGYIYATTVKGSIIYFKAF